MGVKEIFENSADFGNITDSERLKVSKVIQKAFIEVNEEGSEAAAVTGKFHFLECIFFFFFFLCVVKFVNDCFDHH